MSHWLSDGHNCSFSVLASCLSSSTRAYACRNQSPLTHWAYSTSVFIRRGFTFWYWRVQPSISPRIILSQHSPEVRWDTSEILRWSKTWIQNCLSNVPVPLFSNPKLQVHSTLVESPPIPIDSHGVLGCVQQTGSHEVTTAWDCAIDLLPGVGQWHCSPVHISPVHPGA